ncbi:uncharacterized protein METZ01_LOCUS517729, partial [marine metagenome]
MKWLPIFIYTGHVILKYAVLLIITVFVMSSLMIAKRETGKVIKNIQTLRSEIPKNIQLKLPDGSQTSVGRCGFVHLKSDEYKTLDRRGSVDLDISIPIAFHVIYSELESSPEGYVSPP